MGFIFEGIARSLHLIVTANSEVMQAVAVSLKVGSLSTLIATAISIPSAFCIAGRSFKGKRLLLTVINTLMGLPTVAVGLIVYAFLSRVGPLGRFGLLFTPAAIVIGQVILAVPIITAIGITAIGSVDKRVRETALTLGANARQASLAVFREGRTAIFAAIIAGFGRVIAEIGVAMMLGGNIKGVTRTMTTAIALETSRGDFSLALAIALILLLIVFSINLIFQRLQGRRS